MPTACSAYGCTNRHSRGKTLQFHRFPMDPVLRKKWVIAVRRDMWKPSKSARLCSDHFTSDSYKDTAFKRYLKPDAVPSIFDFYGNSIGYEKLLKNFPPQRDSTVHKSPKQQHERMQIDLHPNICSFVQTNTQDSQHENEHQNFCQIDSVKSLSSACNFKNIPHNLSSLIENNGLLHTQNRTVPVSSPLSYAASAEAKISSNEAGCKIFLVVPSSECGESGPTKQQLFNQIKSLKEESGPTKQQLLRQIKSLKEKVRQKDRKIRMLQNKIAQVKKAAKVNHIHVLPNYNESIPVELIVDDPKNSSVKPQSQMNSCKFILKKIGKIEGWKGN